MTRIGWSPDGRRLAVGSTDGTVRLWDAETMAAGPVLRGHAATVWCVAWSPDGKILASGSEDLSIQFWDAATGLPGRRVQDHTGPVYALTWSSRNGVLASASFDHTVRLRDGGTGETFAVLAGHTQGVNTVEWSPDGSALASGSFDYTVRVWDTTRLPAVHLRHVLEGHDGGINSVAWASDGKTLASASDDKGVRLWDPSTGQCTCILQAHTRIVLRVSYSPDGRFLASRSADGALMLWRCDERTLTATLDGDGAGAWPGGMAFQPDWGNAAPSCLLGTLNDGDASISFWHLNGARLLTATPATRSVTCTTAKIVLLGDHAVGKTSLGWYLAHGYFKEQAATHGEQSWVLADLRRSDPDGLEREVVLWDFAGQADYRLIHALFLDDAAVALLLFDAADRSDDPLRGVKYWARAFPAPPREMP